MKKLIFLLFLSGYLFAELGINNENQYFSPNLDGVKDTIKIPFKIKEENLIEWRVLILEKIGEKKFKTIRTIQSENAKKQSLNFEKFFARIFAKDKIIQDPNFINWNGKDNKANNLKDGIYYIKIFAEDKFGNQEESNFIPIILDTTPPEVELKLAEKIFSPNEDKRKDNLLLDINVKRFKEFDKWNLTFLDEKNQKVFQAEGSDNVLFKWAGENNKGKKLPEGKYKIELFAEDLAGNKSSTLEDAITLITRFEEAKLTGSAKIFSPNEDGYFDTITFKNELSSLNGLENWALTIHNQDGKVIKKLNQNNNFVKEVSFDGKDEKNNPLKDGLYSAKIKAGYNSGNLIESNQFSFEVDKTPPALQVALENEFFNPKTKKGNRAIRINQKAKGEKNDTYKAQIKNEDGEIVFIQNFGSSLPENFTWNGKDNNQEQISGKYIYTLIGEDEVANISILDTKPFTLITEKLNSAFTADNSSFSPNNDKRLDKAIFTLKINNAYSKIFTKGQIRIVNEKKKMIKTIPVTQLKEKWQWDGKDNNGKLASDNKYLYSFKGEFSTKETTTTPLKPLYLDTTPVDLTIKTKKLIFSPNNDGNLDTIEFENILNPSKLKKEEDRFLLKIKDKDNKVFREFAWQGKIPPKVVWQGTGKNNTLSPDNFYIYEINTVDHAQNQATYKSKPFQLITDIEELTIGLNKKVISQKQAAKIKNLTITPSLNSTKGLEQVDYYLNLANDNLELLNSQNDTTPFVLNLENKTLLPTGDYLLTSQAFFNSGNSPRVDENIYIDNEEPNIEAFSEPDLFSPDNDGINENLTIRLLANDDYKIKKINTWIFRKVEFSNGEKFENTLENYLQEQLPLQTWDWQDGLNQKFSEIVQWDGKGENNSQVESATEYLIFSRIEDEVGLVTVNQSPFLVDILVEKLPDGRLRIILNNINFKFDSDEMIGEYERTLALLIRMLNRFPTYKINIVGHTDSRGSEEYNQDLSIKRAKRVYSFIVKRGVTNSERLEYTGVGESELLIQAEKVIDENIDAIIREKLTEENYRKNRRVEFYLEEREE